MRIFYLITFYLTFFCPKTYSQVEKYCNTEELISMYQPLTNDLKLKFDQNKVNGESLIHGIGVMYTLTTSNNINEFTENQVKEIFNLSIDENVNVLIDSSEIKLEFNTCIRIEYIKDQFKNLGVDIHALKDSMVNLTY